MRKSLALCAATIALAAGHAFAADLRFPPPGPGYLPPAFLPPALPNWSGCYAGANLGGAWAKIDEGNTVGGTLTANPADDMFDGTNLRSSTSFSAGSANTRTNWFDTLTAREGFLSFCSDTTSNPIVGAMVQPSPPTLTQFGD